MKTTDREIIERQIAEYCMLNACSVPSSGLYDGRAGLSIALFRFSKKYCDTRAEDVAFELLEEALLMRNKDISFENGWAGIGYVLLYLIDHGCIDAEFDEFFLEKHQMIIDTCKEMDEKALVRYALVVNYLRAHALSFRSDESMSLARRISSILTKNTIYQMERWESASLFDKDNVGLDKLLNDYSFLAVNCPDLFQLDRIRGIYNKIYQTGLIQRNEFFCLATNDTSEVSIIVEHKPYFLRDLINLCVFDDNLYCEPFIQYLLSAKDIESTLARSVPENHYIPGYGFGMARLLLYLVVSDCVNNSKIPDFV